MGFVFFQVKNDASGIQNRLGFLFFICVNQTFGIIMPIIGTFPLKRQLYKRERASGTYRCSSSYLAQAVSTLPLLTCVVLLLSVPIYWMIGLQVTCFQRSYF
jgi:ABC-type multidrug transport system permease subunit